MHEGDFSHRHTDVRGNRSAGYNLYLSSASAGDGGTLTYVSFAGDEYEIRPTFNTLVIFDVRRSREHLVTPIRSASPRVSVNGWFMGPDTDPATAA
jgi:Rps23 Pro-64 3,4-dihydroxylase Tpa1-like proline 4-hydroxylase